MGVMSDVMALRARFLGADALLVLGTGLAACSSNLRFERLSSGAAVVAIVQSHLR